MGSEKVKEIKKALECCANCNGQSSCNDCPIVEKCYEDENLMPRLALTLINELESKNESLQDLCNKTYENLTKEIDRLENRVKELEEGIAKSMLGCEFLPECTNDKLKEFAERLKEKAKILTLGSVKVSNFLWVNDIDEILKEFIKN